MLRNYLLVAFRNIRKNKIHFFINVGGMTMAFICSIFIMLMVYRHLTFNDFAANKDQLYKVYQQSIGPSGKELGTSMAYPLTPALKNENTGVIKATNILTRGRLVRYGDKTLDMSTTLVSPDFITMFPATVTKGNAATPLADLGNTVITETTAAKLFDKEDPIGKTIESKMGGQWYPFTVTAVVKDFPENGSIRFSILARTEMDPDYKNMENEWYDQNHQVYVQLAGNITQKQAENRFRNLLKKYMSDDPTGDKKAGRVPDENGDFHSLRLMPFTQEHFAPGIGSNGTVSKSFLYILLLISGVIILIASFNFVNLTVGLSYTRTKEIGVRKCLGAGKRQIWLQVWGENVVTILLAMTLALVAVLLLINQFNQRFETKMDIGMLLNPIMISVLVGVIAVVSFISSGYPSAMMSALKTVEVLKGKIGAKKPGFMRNALITAQFVIAIALITCTIIIFQQFNHLRNAPLGYNTTSLISIPIKNGENGAAIVHQLRTRLQGESSIVSVSGSDVNIGRGEDGSTSTSVVCFAYKGESICGQTISGDYDYLKTIGIKPVEGHDFSLAYENDTTPKVLVTQSYAAQFKQDMMAGFSFYIDSSSPKVTVAAIIPDFKTQSVNGKQKPLVIFLNTGKSMEYAWIRVTTANPTNTMNLIKKTYAAIEPGVEFKGSYVNENIDRLYREEQLMARLFSVSAGVAILLSCMGLFGIASIVIRQRVKEIGVRKVLGASVNSIVTLVSKEFIRPVAIAFCIAVPLAWWGVTQWLQDYSYRVEVKWWVFAIAGLLTFLITVCTISFQSIKAALVNPVKSLRSE